MFWRILQPCFFLQTFIPPTLFFLFIFCSPGEGRFLLPKLVGSFILYNIQMIKAYFFVCRYHCLIVFLASLFCSELFFEAPWFKRTAKPKPLGCLAKAIKLLKSVFVLEFLPKIAEDPFCHINSLGIEGQGYVSSVYK